MNKAIAHSILGSLNILLVNCALSVQLISSLLEDAEEQNRDLTEKELEAILDLRIEEQKQVKENILRSIIY
jgi:hypothetical protein